MRVVILLSGLIIIGVLVWIGIVQSGANVPEPPKVIPAVDFANEDLLALSRQLTPLLLSPISEDQAAYDLDALRPLRDGQPRGSARRNLCDLWLKIGEHRRRALIQLRKEREHEDQMERVTRQWATFTSVWSRQILEFESSIGK